MEHVVTSSAPAVPAAVLRAGRFTLGAFALLLAAVLLALMSYKTPLAAGDVEEYLLMTASLSNHGTPEIRAEDMVTATQILPEFKPGMEQLTQGMAEGKDVPRPGYYRGSNGQYYAIHFFGYSALTALPFKLFQMTGVAPLRAYQLVNLAGVFVLGLCLFRLFGSAPRALAGVALFMLCGGGLYWNWTSPECMSAAALLAGLICFTTGAPLRAGFLIGIASLQNPTIVLALGAAPVLVYCLQYRRGAGWLAQVRQVLNLRMLAGLALGFVLFAAAPAFNLLRFGVPSIIARVATDSSLISPLRLFSLYFDLNQGMLVAIPMLALMVLLWGWAGRSSAQRLRQLSVLVLCALLTVALALPALSVHNWNSGANGVMRYAFWCAMPFLLALLLRLREESHWPRVLVGLLLVGQAGAMSQASSYSHVSFSPQARYVMRVAPGLYNPEPEIFAERLMGQEHYSQPDQVYRFERGDKPPKIMFQSNAGAYLKLCGEGRVPAASDHEVISERGWVYLNGNYDCIAATVIQAGAFLRPGVPAAVLPAVVLESGWSANEPTGIWSDGSSSVFTIQLPASATFRRLALQGDYLPGNKRTRVTINGTDMGWHDLRLGQPITLPQHAAGSLRVELRHEAAHSPGPQDGRLLAFFVSQINLR